MHPSKTLIPAVLLAVALVWGVPSEGLAGTSRSALPERTFGSRLNQVGYEVADRLAENLIHTLNRRIPVLATSFVNLDRLEASSTFGRVLGDKVGSRFSQHGYKVIELKLRKGAVSVQEGNGELALTRDLRQIITDFDAQAVIVGTYTIAGTVAYLSTRLVSTADHSILSSTDLRMRLDSRLLAMVENETGPPEKAAAADPPPPGQGPLASGVRHIDPSSSREAMVIQTRLAQMGFYDGEIDGKWGKRSRRALKEFKRNYGLAPLMQWDLDTQKALFRDTNQ
jgi:TolB-like protein